MEHLNAHDPSTILSRSTEKVYSGEIFLSCSQVPFISDNTDQDEIKDNNERTSS